MDTVRIARDFGNVSSVLPDGIVDLRDAPHTFVSALSRGLLILSFEELPRDERPPRRMWMDDELLAAHFKQVDRNREREAKGQSIEDPVENDAASMLIIEDE